ncbi:MAG: SDR family oxidoreductase [Acidimicrobiales bacterium]|jgi:3-oxoacyl-[acyl-carrier protein] reductase|uniref:Short-chain dehydrogenase n=1 Tax=marine metagenome TaxID=408172 RepID=A0A382MNI4_9ZZZZ|nr:SDR family oxidoreductase [Actinomycetes bacterium]MDP6106805.1 SDR family oxidoreductase [Acidimicrobiales bacterium]MCP4843929.1 SDR family oxidoreductase [Actinomycetes bacterium]MDP6240837.1 SDR family oxidoreductase [Acidimicrobiales bacterium]MDP7125806.1 SDR family oxidoreductase [Acidimicrobiales bacterium]|tara:strand:+ start:171 stop:914 length:744 start_codon:yes stop_codon:yes gene_type:complete
MDLGISGRTALVTGASTGLGLACARALAAEGARVALASRSVEKLAAAAATIEGDPVVLTVDLSEPASIDALVDDATAALGQVDILVANGGGPPPGNFASTEVDAYQAALQLNLLSMVALTKAFVPPMQERGWGRVVAVTSAAVRQPMANLILSNTARSGLTAFLKTTALEVAGDGVIVNTVQPGLHATDRLAQLYDDLDGVADSVPTGRLGDPGDFGRIVAFLCSESAKSIIGASVPVDSGAVKGLQ